MDDAKVSLDAQLVFRFKGMISNQDRHSPQLHNELDYLIAPKYVEVPDGYPVPQYSPTVYGTSTKYNPAGDCEGNFTSFKFMVDNNCYNYACNVATNSFAQPGRATGNPYKTMTGEAVVAGAVSDGLVLIEGGDTITLDHVKKNLRHQALTEQEGHLVGLMISEPDSTVGWPGDYHWCRCDNTWAAVNDGAQMTWSQKDGPDQMTNFDFAGFPITNPVYANWTVNEGSIMKGSVKQSVVRYYFYTFMFVPGVKKINII